LTRIGKNSALARELLFTLRVSEFGKNVGHVSNVPVFPGTLETCPTFLPVAQSEVDVFLTSAEGQE